MYKILRIKERNEIISVEYYYAIILFIILNFSVSAQWEKTNYPSNVVVSALTVKGEFIFAGSEMAGGIRRSADKGMSWSSVNSGLSYPYINCLISGPDGTNLFVATSFGGVSLSTDNGDNWIPINNGLADSVVSRIAITPDGLNLYAGTRKGIYRSTNNGSNWIDVSNEIMKKEGTYSIAISNDGNNIFACPAYSNGLYLSTDNGINWKSVTNGLPDTKVFSVNVNPDGGEIIAVVQGYSTIYASTDGGSNWSSIKNNLPNISISCTVFSPDGKYIFLGTQGGIYFSSDNGTKWYFDDSGFSDPYISITSLVTSSDATNIYAGTSNHGLWKRTISELVTSVATHRGKDLSKYFRLYQNYPNPFNPTTKIDFEISSRSFITLKIYDVLGKEISTLVEEELSPGHYSKNWDAKMFSSGIYLYTLKSDNFEETKKLLLIK
ncbi:MAG: T9SS type A sorting domain-containing protein [Ignavibacteria bacterium]|jgi:photosystem II stability/assembly factor-like uncharacterized protein